MFFICHDSRQLDHIPRSQYLTRSSAFWPPWDSAIPNESIQDISRVSALYIWDKGAVRYRAELGHHLYKPPTETKKCWMGCTSKMKKKKQMVPKWAKSPSWWTYTASFIGVSGTFVGLHGNPQAAKSSLCRSCYIPLGFWDDDRGPKNIKKHTHLWGMVNILRFLTLVNIYVGGHQTHQRSHQILWVHHPAQFSLQKPSGKPTCSCGSCCTVSSVIPTFKMVMFHSNI